MPFLRRPAAGRSFPAVIASARRISRPIVVRGATSVEPVSRAPSCGAAKPTMLPINERAPESPAATALLMVGKARGQTARLVHMSLVSKPTGRNEANDR
jgi:hypothetical protein